MPKDSASLTPDLLLHGYTIGVFPMSDGRNDPDIFWVDPKRRGVLPLTGFHISRSLARDMRRTAWRFSVNAAFEAVIDGCADRPQTWINTEIQSVYAALHRTGYAHSVEVWDGRELIGGVYGVALGAAFFGESMFSRRTNASKMALAACVERMQRGGFTLYDTQFLTAHLKSLGGIEIPRARYHVRLANGLERRASFTAPRVLTPAEVLHRLSPDRALSGG